MTEKKRKKLMCPSPLYPARRQKAVEQNEGLLLTPEERVVTILRNRNRIKKLDGSIDRSKAYKVMCEAQLDKAKPIIEKQERERIIAELEDYIMPNEYDPDALTYILFKDDLQALKEGGRQELPSAK